ncbi:MULTISPECIES: hypothetical protein [Pseudomonas]|uniref:Uncharacterized protein n=1 Tax=Pseudomonas gessardii TaxID=78544 RepID=A0A7Y1MVX9_9PSED|nr:MULTISPECIES: hypothetical protein [Pseudomonas]NNA99022.1 hypothetical protein [Pseudomonas gessardii]
MNNATGIKQKKEQNKLVTGHRTSAKRSTKTDNLILHRKVPFIFLGLPHGMGRVKSLTGF